MVKSTISDELPKKYLERHCLMLYLYDILVDILMKADAYNLSDSIFAGDLAEKNLSFDDLEERESLELGAELVGRHFLFSILRDMCYYLYESLSCIERGKVTVAYTLARKPLQDNLYYLCWLLDNPIDLYENMKNKSPDEYDVSVLKGEKESVKAMYERVIKKINESKLIDFELFTPELLYELIYDRTSKSGLSQVFDKSIHLVTRNRHYKTERKNLNFIFVDDKIWDEFWEYYYIKLPFILMFIVEVAIKNFEIMLLIPESICKINQLIRELKFSIALNFEEKGSFEKLLEYTIKHSLTITCDECKNNVLSSEDSIKEFKEDYLYTCSNCKNIERIGQYYISDAFLKEQLVLDASKENNMYKLKSKYKRKQSGK